MKEEAAPYHADAVARWRAPPGRPSYFPLHKPAILWPFPLHKPAILWPFPLNKPASSGQLIALSLGHWKASLP